MALTPLQNRIISEIIAHIRRENLAVGSRLTELHFANLLGTTRSPIRVAFMNLKRRKVVRFEANKGFFLAVEAASLADVAEEVSDAAQDSVYLKIAEARLNHVLPDDVMEADLIRMFGVSRSRLRKTLSRILAEGWIERRVGHGWSFLPMLDSDEAYREALFFRIPVETSGILSPKFVAPPLELRECRRRQEFLLKGGLKILTPLEIWEANAWFHETLARWSGNRFILQAVQRLARLQALVGFRQAGTPANTPTYQKSSFEQHLDILEMIEKREFSSAAALMRQHLEAARQRTPFGKARGP
jgi:DNA-binding GntR family transcriptional regulator